MPAGLANYKKRCRFREAGRRPANGLGYSWPGAESVLPDARHDRSDNESEDSREQPEAVQVVLAAATENPDEVMPTIAPRNATRARCLSRRRPQTGREAAATTGKGLRLTRFAEPVQVARPRALHDSVVHDGP